jgi:hypothetical protein
MKRAKQLILRDTPQDALLRQGEVKPGSPHSRAYSHTGWVHLTGTAQSSRLGQDHRMSVGLATHSDQWPPHDRGKWIDGDGFEDLIEQIGTRAHDRIVSQILDDLNRGVYQGIVTYSRQGRPIEQSWELKPGPTIRGWDRV